MSDPLFVFKINGKEYTAPAADAERIMKQLDDDGVKFDATQAPAAPQEPAQSPAAPAGVPLQQMGALEMLGELGRRGWNSSMEGLGDLERGWAQGMTWRGGDEISAAGDPQRLAEFRAADEESRARSPWIYGAGEAIGAVTPGLVTGPAALASGGLARLGAGMAEGAIQGAATGAAGANTDDPEAAAWAALAGGGFGAAGGAVVPALGAAAKWAKPYAQGFARRAQANVEGLTGPAFRKVADALGIDRTRDEVAQAALETAPPHLFPKTADWYRTQRGEMAEATGAEVGAATDALASDVPQAIKVDDFAGRMDTRGSRYLQSTVREERAKAGAMDELRDEVLAKYSGQKHLSPTDLQTEKVAWSQRGYPRDATISTSDADRAAFFRDASSVPREALRESADLALPSTQARYLNALDDHADQSILADTTARKAGMDESQPRGGLWSLLTGPIQDRAADATSLTMQRASGGLGALDRFSQASGQFPTQSIPGAMAGRVAGDWQQAQHERERISAASMGHNLEGAVLEALQTNPAALGPYAQRFQEAQGSGDPMRMTSLLYEAERDPAFRLRFMQGLQKSTNPTGNY